MAAAKKSGARYLDSALVKRKSLRSRFTSVFSIVATVLVVGLSVGMGSLASASINSAKTGPSIVAADAGTSGICSVIGANMDSRMPWQSAGTVPLPNVDNRYFTLSEIAGGSLWWSIYNGTGDGDGVFLVNSYDDEAKKINADRTDANKLPLAADLPSELKDFRDWGPCFWTGIPATLGGLGLNFANFIATSVSWIATSAFNPSFICDADASSTASAQTGCIDLVSIIGGRSNDAGQGGTGEGASSGIIGSLTTGLYKPLVIIVVLVTALLVLWTGIVKRRFREAFGQAAWLAVSFIIGLTLILNSSILVKGPMILGNTILGCIVGSFNGSGGCVGNSSGPDTSGTQPASKAVCVSGANGATPSEQTTFYINSMTCSIWSAFVLEPYARGAFGTGVSGLEMSSPIDGGTNTVGGMLSGDGWNKGGGTGAGSTDSYCVRLGGSSSYNDMPATFSGTTGPKICNLAVWDILMKTQYTGGGITSASTNPDPAWFQMMSRLPASDSLFATYTNQGAGVWFKFFMGTIAWIAALVGGFIIALTSGAALVYYIMAIIMLAFAPIFFLIGMHPGRGKKIMLGWLSQIISNFLKYVVSGVFVLVAVSFYGAILGSSGSIEGSLLFIVLISAALFMYRKELINLLGRVDMGGEQMTNAADSFFQRSNSAAKRAKSVTTGITAGALAGLATRGPKGVMTGAGVATMRELRSGTGIVARSMQAASTISADNKADARNAAGRKGAEAARMETNAKQIEEDLHSTIDRAKPAAQNIKNAKDASDKAAIDKDNALDEVELTNQAIKPQNDFNEQVVTLFIKGDFANKHQDLAKDYGKLQGYERDSSILDRQIQDAKTGPNADPRVAHELSERKKTIDVKISEMSSKYAQPELASAKNAYAKTEDSVLRNLPTDPETREKFLRGNELNNNLDEASKLHRDADVANQRRIIAEQQLISSGDEYLKLKTEWNDGFGAQLQGMTDRLSEMRTDAATARGEETARREALDKYTAGDIRTVRSINKDMKEADAKAVREARDTGFSKGTNDALADLQEITGTDLTSGARGEYHEAEAQSLATKIAKQEKKESRADLEAKVSDLMKEEMLKNPLREFSKNRAAKQETRLGEEPRAQKAAAAESVSQREREVSSVAVEKARAEELVRASANDVERENNRKAVDSLNQKMTEAQANLDASKKLLHDAETLERESTQKARDIQEKRARSIDQSREAFVVPPVRNPETLTQSQVGGVMQKNLQDEIARYMSMKDNTRDPQQIVQLQQFAEAIETLGRHSTDADVSRVMKLMPGKRIPTLPILPKRPGSDSR